MFHAVLSGRCEKLQQDCRRASESICTGTDQARQKDQLRKNQLWQFFYKKGVGKLEELLYNKTINKSGEALISKGGLNYGHIVYISKLYFLQKGKSMA